MSVATRKDLSTVLTTINRARGLPNEHYISNNVFAEENQSLLVNKWSGIGFGKDVPEAGDVMPVSFLGMPLLIVRDHEGEISVFQNTCRHRGMILVQEPTKIRKAIRCPYHSWCYGLDGKLNATPYVGGPKQNTHKDVCPAELSLFKVRSWVWRDVVFVNVSGDAPEFVEYAASLIERWQEFEQPIFHGGDSSSFKLEVKTNWKLAVENYCESYHLPWVHPGLNSYSRLEDHYHIEQPGAFSGQGTLVYRQLTDEDGSVFSDYPGLSAQWNSGAEYVALYPNVLFGVHRDHSYAIILEPVAVDHTIEHVELYYAAEHTTTSAFDGMRSANARLWKTVFAEDVSVVEGMQQGRHGVMFDGGKFSPVMDNPTHTFHHWVAEQVTAYRQQQ
jgi:phenylpropionate dioxygenase-like ring-hydroxylating dioxygenase large terminal subunit